MTAIGGAEAPIPAGRSLDLDALAAQWWLAFEASQSALQAAGHAVSPEDLREFSRRLTEQHDGVAHLLQGLARDRRATSPLVQWLGGPRLTRRVLGLPDDVIACVFDLDGVLTTSAGLHAAAWADTFHGFLFERAERGRQEIAPFDRHHDYDLWFAGRPRLDGVRAFLASRGISLPEGGPDDPPGAQTVHGLANRKRDRLQARLELEGVTAFAGSRSYLEAARIFDVHCAVVSPSANTAAILEGAGLAHLIEQRVDGNTTDVERLRPKPFPDVLLSACERLRVPPDQSAAFETTPTGISAARAAAFKLVIGVNRSGHSPTLRPGDADLVVNDLAELLTRDRRPGRRSASPTRPAKRRRSSVASGGRPVRPGGSGG